MLADYSGLRRHRGGTPVIKYERWWHVATPGSAFVDAMAVLEVLVESRMCGASAATDASIIRSRTRLGFDESRVCCKRCWMPVGLAASSLNSVSGSMGKRITEGMDSWTLLANPRQLKVASLPRVRVQRRRQSGACRQVERAVEQGLGQTLAYHFAKAQ